MKKMNSQVKAMVESVNERMRENHIKDTQDVVFTTTCWLLLRAKCYHGYNYFTKDGRLSGGNTESFDHLEIYIK